ncbi:hypothetical protein C5Y96_20880 [Blastopirellula marina]|uniref:Uncharacterized protein n=1 Tax=Blastopirellula marina TaxID=124 RepID=A0A2S8F1A2_9BACT|nr:MULTISPECIES: hypothetical protein [Pirellulaceae]PQO25913.1 hypothetical protein C5Y96_20880 [Blastopirellula marina]RCS44271.1 hypothetical protein DTL36_20925 [Bremerella cremea]
MPDTPSANRFRFNIRTFLLLIGMVGVILAFINYTEIDFFGPRLDEYTMSNGNDNRWGLVLSRGRPRIGYYDQFGETGTEPEDWQVYGNRVSTLVVRRKNERIFPVDGGLRLFFRRADEEWEEVFIPDEDLKEWLDSSNHLHNAREFFEKYAQP